MVVLRDSREALDGVLSDDLGVEHPAPDLAPGDIVFLADGREALVTMQVEWRPGLLEVLEGDQLSIALHCPLASARRRHEVRIDGDARHGLGHPMEAGQSLVVRGAGKSPIGMVTLSAGVAPSIQTGECQVGMASRFEGRQSGMRRDALRTW